MAFDIRCPECKAKLRLDEAPDPDTPIECPRCGSQFAAPDEAPAAAGKPPAKAPGKVPKRKKAKKKKTNPAVLLIAIFAGLVCIVAIGFGLHWFVGRAGKVEEMLTYVPGDCNWARGVNTGQLAAYPGYNDQVSRFNTANVKAASDDCARAAGQNSADFLNYLVIAKSRQTSGTGTMYVLRSKKPFNKSALGAGLTGASPVNVGGETCHQVGAGGSGVLAGAVVYFPTDRLIVIVPPGPMQNQMINGAVAGKSNKKGSFAAQLDTTGWMVIKGSIWLLVRQTGALSNYVPDSLGGAAKDFPKLEDKARKAKTFGEWTTPGGTGVRFGAGIECESGKDAEELVSYFRNGPLGKEDESEPPNNFRQAFNFAGDKRAFGEFMQFLSYKKSGPCAYITTKLEGDNAKKLMNIFNSPTMASDEAPAGFGGPPVGGPPGPGRPPGP